MTRKAAIVGGGIGGLAAAVGLRQVGWEVTVFERAGRHAETGAGLGIWPTALRALDVLGLGHGARDLGRRQPSGAIFRPDGSRIAAIDVDKVERREGDPVYLLSRPALLRLLASALPAGAVRYGRSVEALPEGFDVVVGADGINSAIRRAMFGTAPALASSGLIGWRGTLNFDLRAASETWGRGIKFGLTPQEPGVTNWYATLPRPCTDAAELRRVFGHWHDPIPRVLDLIDPASTMPHELLHLPPLPAYSRGHVALLGDAAHAMTPDLGQGACQAMIDAVALARALSSSGGVPEALRRYDAERRAPTQRLAAMSLWVNKLTRMKRHLRVRDLIVKAALFAGPPH